jgi:hypothetical protein
MVAKTFLARTLVVVSLLAATALHAAQRTSLDGPWKIATDPNNVGKAQNWFRSAPPAGALNCRVPGVIQQTFPAYHGVVWYWKTLSAPQVVEQERLQLKFGAADYFAEAWLNGQYLGSHEGGETPFTFDITHAVKPGADNSLVVRLINPDQQRIDGITLNETPHGIKKVPMAVGNFWDPGGLWQSVELLKVPAIRVADVFVDAQREAKTIHARLTIANDTGRSQSGRLVFDLTPSGADRPILSQSQSVVIPSGKKTVEVDLKLDEVHAWSPDDPYLYRLNSRLSAGPSSDVYVTRTGFRDFIFRDGYFRLNGRRIFLRSAHSVGHFPIGQHVPSDPELLRRELLYVKSMGFNTVRWLGRTMFPSQLELCDELGLMVYEESYASWNLNDSPDMGRRFDFSVRDMILRDRNHPSLVMWGLLNETVANSTFRHATGMLPLVRSIDPTRLVMLSSGRWDAQWTIGSIANPGESSWQYELGPEAANANSPQQVHPEGYAPGSGDIHMYPVRPWPDESMKFIRMAGTGAKNVILSEYGNGSQIDPIRIVKLMQQNGANPELEDYKLYDKMAVQLDQDWKEWKLDHVFASPSDMIVASQELQSEQRRLALNAIRSNPHFAGYNLTGLSDQAIEGEGLMTTFRELKPGIMDAMNDGFAPVKWCLFAGPTHVYQGATVHLEAVLADEDVLKPGSYPVRIKVVGPGGIVFEKARSLEIPDPHTSPEPPMVFSAFDEEVRLTGPEGKYQVEVTFDSGAAAVGREEIIVGDVAHLPSVAADVQFLGTNEGLSRFVTSHGAKIIPGQETTNANPHVILIAGHAEGNENDWLSQVSTGSVAILLDPSALPPELGGSIEDSGPRFWGRDDIVTPHPVFDGLPSRRLMDLFFYRDLIARKSIVGFGKDTENVVPTFAVGKPGGQGYWSGSNLLVYNVGRGKVIVCTLRILDNLEKNPAADRVLLNMLSFAASERNPLP